MLSLSATLSRPIARLAVALGVSVFLIGSSLPLPISQAAGALKPLHADLTRQIASSDDDVNEDGANLESNSSTVWFGTGANAASSYTGLRFTNIAIPQGATITSAKLQVYLPSSAWNQLEFTYAAENAANSATFTSSNRPSQRTLTTQTVSHSSDVQWPATTWYDLDEISSVVQPVISRGDWASGNALSIILKGVGGAYGRKFVVAYDGAATYAVRLAITYSTGGPTPTNTAVAPTSTPTTTRTNTPVGPTATATTAGGGTQLSRQVVGSSDDVNEDGSGFEADYGTVWLGTGADASASYTGLRFTNIAIPQGATIASAKLQVYLSNSSWSQLSFNYFAENTSNSATFAASNRPSQRTLTSQSVAHTSDVNWPATTWIDLDEIGSVVQPVISRGDWTSGNALAIILRGVGGAYGRKFVTALDGAPANAVRLVIVYSASTPTPTRTSTPSATPTRTQTSTATRTATVTPTTTATNPPSPTRTSTTLPTITPNPNLGEGYPGPGDPEPPAVAGPYRVLLPNIARGIPPKPATTTSWYRVYVNTDSESQGCAVANQRALGTQGVILDFGSPWVTTIENEYHVPVPAYGVRLFPIIPGEFTEVFVQQIESSVRSFVTGFANCAGQIGLSPQARVEVIVGLNHDDVASQVSYEHGQEWAATIARIGDWLNSSGYNSRASVAAGMDFEPSFDGPYSAAKSWLDGYLSLATRPLYNFGTCEGCAYTGYQAGFINGWSEDGLWYVSASTSFLRVIPEIYTTDPNDGTPVHARQWAQLASWASSCGGSCLPAQIGRRGPIPIWGVLTQVQACIYVGNCPEETMNSASTSWNQLHVELIDNLTPIWRPLTIIYSTDIDWQRP